IISSNNLKQIVLAMHNHSDNNDHRLPAHAIYDTHGTPLLSWRVLILPYVEEETLFKQFKLDEPLDSPHNLPLLPHIPPVYAPPPRFKSSALPGHSFYQVFIGQGAAFEGKEGMRMPIDFPYGLANTILVVEAGEAVPWTKPQDISYSPSRPL